MTEWIFHVLASEILHVPLNTSTLKDKTHLFCSYDLTVLPIQSNFDYPDSSGPR